MRAKGEENISPLGGGEESKERVWAEGWAEGQNVGRDGLDGLLKERTGLESRGGGQIEQRRSVPEGPN